MVTAMRIISRTLIDIACGLGFGVSLVLGIQCLMTFSPFFMYLSIGTALASYIIMKLNQIL
jgi:hypothetical protein